MPKPLASLMLLIFGLSMIVPSTLPAQAATTRTIAFSGYTWNVKSGVFAPANNQWDNTTQGVFTDATGALHLRVSERNGQWYSSEVTLPQKLGYGTYEFQITSRVDLTDRNLVASPFIYQDDEHEIDIEYTKWKSDDPYNVYNSVHPVRIPGAHTKFNMNMQPGSPLVARIIWEPTGITLQNLQNGVMLNSWRYEGQNNVDPSLGLLHINHWMIDATPPSDGQAHDFVIKSFKFVPYSTQQSQPEPTPAPVAETTPTPAPAPTPTPVVTPQPAPTPTTAIPKLPYNSPQAIRLRHEAARQKAIAAHRARLAIEQEARKQALIAKIGLEAYNAFLAEMAKLNQ